MSQSSLQACHVVNDEGQAPGSWSSGPGEAEPYSADDRALTAEPILRNHGRTQWEEMTSWGEISGEGRTAGGQRRPARRQGTPAGEGTR